MSTPTAQPATEALLAFAAATREDIDLDDLRQAIAACWSAGWHWERIAISVVLVLMHGEEPRDLRAALTGPYGGKPP
ncbi:hypothetical protein ACFVH6_22125 [Spirillospora sp. NPDC127200]